MHLMLNLFHWNLMKGKLLLIKRSIVRGNWYFLSHMETRSSIRDSDFILLHYSRAFNQCMQHFQHQRTNMQNEWMIDANILIKSSRLFLMVGHASEQKPSILDATFGEINAAMTSLSLSSQKSTRNADSRSCIMLKAMQILVCHSACPGMVQCLCFNVNV